MRDHNVTENGTGNTKLSIHGHGYHVFTRAFTVHEHIATVNVSICTAGFWGSRLVLFVHARPGSWDWLLSLCIVYILCILVNLC